MGKTLKKSERDKLVQSVIHNLNNSLQVISGEVELLSMEGERKLTKDQKGSLDRIHLATANLKKIKDDLRDIIKPEKSTTG